jgi:hypothetical protein
MRALYGRTSELFIGATPRSVTRRSGKRIAGGRAVERALVVEAFSSIQQDTVVSLCLGLCFSCFVVSWFA